MKCFLVHLFEFVLGFWPVMLKYQCSIAGFNNISRPFEYDGREEMLHNKEYSPSLKKINCPIIELIPLPLADFQTQVSSH